MAESCPQGKKTPWEKENLLVTSKFSFSHSAFKRLELPNVKRRACLGKGLTFFERLTGPVCEWCLNQGTRHKETPLPQICYKVCQTSLEEASGCIRFSTLDLNQALPQIFKNHLRIDRPCM